jgi:DNA-binding response OmpR family regulator
MRAHDSKVAVAPPWAVLCERGPLDPATTPRQALVVEDEKRLAALLGDHLATMEFDVHVEHGGEGGLMAALSPSLSLIVLDVVLPGRSGFEIASEVRRQHLTTPILMLSARGVTEDRVRGLDCGADDYLTKPFGVRELVARAAALLRRTRTPIDAEDEARGPTLSLHGLDIDPARRRVTVRGTPVDVTRQEFGLLYLLASHPGIVYTRERLLAKVWQGQAYVTARSVDTLVKRLRRKIEDDPAEPRILLTVWGDGYKFADV